MQRRALIVATIPGFFRHMQTVIASMHELGYVVDAATNFREKTAVSFSAYNKLYQIDIKRSPCSHMNLRALRQLRRIIENVHYDIVFCNTPVGGVLGRLATMRSRGNGTKVIYMAHGFHFYTGAPIRYWLTFFPVEWLCSWITDAIITINTEDYERALRLLHSKRTFFTHGVGFDSEKFYTLSRDIKIRTELGMVDGERLLLSIGELNKNKNHQVVIRALPYIQDAHYAIAGLGNRDEQLVHLANKIGVGNRFHILGYRDDVDQLYASSDAFMFPSIREGLSVSLMEAMASGLPCVCKRIRGNIDLIDDGINGIFVDEDSPEEWGKALHRAIELRDKGYICNEDKLRYYCADEVKKEIVEILAIVTKGDSV